MITLVGSFSVVSAGTSCNRPHDKRTVGGKARTLLMLLTAERRRTVPIDRIVTVLWGDDPPKRPVHNVATLVSRLRRTLGTPAVMGGRGGYRLGAAPLVSVDLDEAAALVIEAEARLTADDPALAGVAATRALEILDAGSALEGEADAPWAAPARNEAAGLLRRARHVAADAALRGAEPAAAQRVAEAAVAADPYDEGAHRLLMRAHHAAGEPARALLVYERLRATLSSELGTDPAPETRAVHVAILREQHDDPPARPGSVRAARSVPAGRDAALDRVVRAWAGAASGRTNTLVVAGTAGIGKSRLAAEAVRIAESAGGTVMPARCHEAERSLFLQPFVDALTPQIARLAGSALSAMVGHRAADLAMLVPDLVNEATPPPMEHGIAGLTRSRLYDAVAVFMRGLAARRPVLLVLEDVHNADRATVELVGYLARRVTSTRLLIVVTTRPDARLRVLRSIEGAVSWIDLGEGRSARNSQRGLPASDAGFAPSDRGLRPA